MLEELEDKYSKYEIARILGARSLQVAMDAPLLLKISKEELEEINYNPIEIAKREMLADVLPITVDRPMPEKRKEKIKILTKEQIEEKLKEKEEQGILAEEKAEKEIEEKENKEAPKDAAEIKSDESLEKIEVTEEKKIEEDAEIMELAKPDDEAESELQPKVEGEEI
jgi:DNA-directed RNA polymerase subunit K